MATVSSWGADSHGVRSGRPAGPNAAAMAPKVEGQMAFVLDDGRLAVAGNGPPGRLGRIAADPGVLDPPDGSGFVAVDVGRLQGVALRDDGSFVGWGVPCPWEDRLAFVGRYDSRDSDVEDRDGYSQVVAGDGWAAALRADGSVAVFGWMRLHADPEYRDAKYPPELRVGSGAVAMTDSRPVGDVTYVMRRHPVPTGAGFTRLVARGPVGLAIRPDGPPYAVPFGVCSDFLADVPAAPLADAAIGSYGHGAAFAVGLKLDGVVVAWGHDPRSRASVSDPFVPAGVLSGVPSGTGFRAVAAGIAAAFALTDAGAIVGWGWAGGGERSGIPSGSGYTAIAAGNADLGGAAFVLG